MSQDRLNEMTEKHLTTLLTKGDDDAKKAINTLLDESKGRRDFFLKLGEGMQSKFHSNGHVLLQTPKGDYTLHNNALTQLSERYKIGSRFVKTLTNGQQQWQRDLIAHNLNEFSIHNERSRFLMRSVNNEIRGVLTDQYKIMDSAEIASKFLEEAMKSGAVFAGGYNSGLNMWLEVVKRQMIQVETENNGTISLIFGGRFKSADYGNGALDMRVFFIQTVCLNGLVGETVLHERHLGEKLPEGYNFSRKIHAAHTKLMMMKVAEMTKNLFSDERIASEIRRIKKASKVEIDGHEYLERLNKNGLILKGELEEAEQVMINNRTRDGVQGEMTLWKLSQSISAIARKKEPIRQRELMEIGGKLLFN